MKVDEKGDGTIATAGFIGYMEGNSQNRLKVSNLIVEGNVNAAGTNDTGCAGGICGYASFVKIEFCRFNGTVSGSGKILTACGGIVGDYEGSNNHSLTCCISDAEVTTVRGQSGSKHRGGLVGCLNNGPVTYSAWNSSRITKGVSFDMYNSFADTNESFTNITGLNKLLDAMNNSKPESDYKWKAGDNTNTASPILVKRTPSGTN